MQRDMNVINCGYHIPGGVQGQLGQGLEQPGIVEGVPAHGRGWNWRFFNVPFNSDLSIIPQITQLELLMQQGKSSPYSGLASSGHFEGDAILLCPIWNERRQEHLGSIPEKRH